MVELKKKIDIKEKSFQRLRLTRRLTQDQIEIIGNALQQIEDERQKKLKFKKKWGCQRPGVGDVSEELVSLRS